MMVSGVYEYTVRNFYVTFIKAKKTTNEEDLTFLEEEYNKEILLHINISITIYINRLIY